MKAEDLKSLLEFPELNASGVAAKMFEGKANPRGRLNDKINNRKSGNGFQRLTEDDLDRAKHVLKDLADEIYRRIGEE